MKTQLVLFFVIVMSLFGNLAEAHDHPSTHGMFVMAGGGKVYLSHLPMFHPPHDYQALIEASLGEAAEAALAQDQAMHPEEKIYTLVPETFVLPDMIAKPHAFKATLFRGHFERGGVAIAEVSAALMTKILYFKKLDSKQPTGMKPKYLSLAGGFLVHMIQGQPGFDQILKTTGSKAANGQILVAPGLLPEESGAVVLKDAATGAEVEFAAVSQLYLETGDLE